MSKSGPTDRECETVIKDVYFNGIRDAGNGFLGRTLASTLSFMAGFNCYMRQSK